FVHKVYSRWSEVELFRVVPKKLAVHPSPDQPPVGVDIDLSYPQPRRRQVLLFVYPARAGVQFPTRLVDAPHLLFRDTGAAVHNDGCAGKKLLDFTDDLK